MAVSRRIDIRDADYVVSQRRDGPMAPRTFSDALEGFAPVPIGTHSATLHLTTTERTSRLFTKQCINLQ
jgi:hypothetical protein